MKKTSYYIKKIGQLIYSFTISVTTAFIVTDQLSWLNSLLDYFKITDQNLRKLLISASLTLFIGALTVLISWIINWLIKKIIKSYDKYLKPMDALISLSVNGKKNSAIKFTPNSDSEYDMLPIEVQITINYNGLFPLFVGKLYNARLRLTINPSPYLDISFQNNEPDDYFSIDANNHLEINFFQHLKFQRNGKAPIITKKVLFQPKRVANGTAFCDSELICDSKNLLIVSLLKKMINHQIDMIQIECKGVKD